MKKQKVRLTEPKGAGVISGITKLSSLEPNGGWRNPVRRSRKEMKWIQMSNDKKKKGQ